jgi:hypothetical protein
MGLGLWLGLGLKLIKPAVMSHLLQGDINGTRSGGRENCVSVSLLGLGLGFLLFHRENCVSVSLLGLGLGLGLRFLLFQWPPQRHHAEGVPHEDNIDSCGLGMARF